MEEEILVRLEPGQREMAALRAGDVQGFEAVYCRFCKPLLAFLVGMTGDRNTAEELLQRVFVGLARRAPHLPEDTNVRAHLFASARNSVASYRRTRMRRARFEEGSEVFARWRAGADSDGLSTLEREDLRGQLNRALAGLPGPQREAVLLRTHGEMTFQEIAEATGVPLGTVATRYRIGIRKLQEAMSDER